MYCHGRAGQEGDCRLRCVGAQEWCELNALGNIATKIVERKYFIGLVNSKCRFSCGILSYLAMDRNFITLKGHSTGQVNTGIVSAVRIHG